MLTTSQSFRLIRNQFHVTGQKGKTIPLELQLENDDNSLKAFSKAFGANLNKANAQRVAASVSFILPTRRLAACTQAVVILRSTSYIAVELNVLHFKTPVI